MAFVLKDPDTGQVAATAAAPSGPGPGAPTSTSAPGQAPLCRWWPGGQSRVPRPPEAGVGRWRCGQFLCSLRQHRPPRSLAPGRSRSAPGPGGAGPSGSLPRRTTGATCWASASLRAPPAWRGPVPKPRPLFPPGRRSTAPWTRAPRPRARRPPHTSSRPWARMTPRTTSLCARQVSAAAGRPGVLRPLPAAPSPGHAALLHLGVSARAAEPRGRGPALAPRCPLP